MSVFSLLIWLVYAYSLGAAATLAYRYAPSVFPRWGRVLRGVPGVMVITYYGLSVAFPHVAVKAVLHNAPVPLGDDLRFQSGAIALSLSLYILARRAGRTE